MRVHASPVRRAFSLSSLIVVIAVIALLIGLLLPAIMRVRGSTARLTSLNNLKQIGLAIHNYHDTYTRLPAGNTKENVSVAVELLPYIEQENVYKLYTTTGRGAVEKFIIKTYLSPRDPQTTVTEGVGATNYLYSAGTMPALKDNDGMFYLDSKVTIADVTDGLSNTFMVGETLKGASAEPATVARQHVQLKAGDLKNANAKSGVDNFKDGKNVVADRCASWANGSFLQGTYTATRVPNAAEPDVAFGGVGGFSALRSLDEIVPILQGDGAVRSVRATIDEKVWQAAHTRAGGEVVDLD